MRGLALVALIALSTGAAAFSYSVRLNGRIISEGDSAGKVMEIAGKPDRTVQLVNKYGAGVASRWEYYRDGKTIMVTVQNGKVIHTEEVD